MASKTNDYIGYVYTQEFDDVINKLRSYCRQCGMMESCTQSRLDIVSACEEPETIAKMNYNGKVYPLKQTGQMVLEQELLELGPKLNNVTGFYTLTTSYRQEPNPVPGRHNLVFPLFEFEIYGGLDELIKWEKGLLDYLGFNEKSKYFEDDYETICKKYNTDEIDHDEEKLIEKDYGPVFFLKNFPQRSSPFWNMKKDESDPTISKKVDVILCGIETIGSAERSCNPLEMRKSFETISNGEYANTLYNLFSKERVDNELDEFLDHTFVPRSGGGIGITRLIRAMRQLGLLDHIPEHDVSNFCSHRINKS